MKYRTIKYLKRQKALKNMQHPSDLKSFLKAEFEASKSVLVKKHILDTLHGLNHPDEVK
ncbi:MAG TPA: hypothetical protein VN721_01345 [Flavipsychrobacter sp.]|nr:hypothetical protein [Flavipsychrobacter sp.]